MNTQTIHVNTINRPYVKNYVTVIIRAFGDEPVRLQVVGFDGKTVQVIGSNPSEPVSFPVQWVYSDDGDTYKDLLAAFTAGDSGRLLKLWKAAGMFNG